MARYYASTNNANWGIFYDVTEGSYSIENNTSPVGVNVYLYRTSSSSYYGGTANISFTLNGETKSTSAYPSYPTNIGVGEANAHLMASFSYTVPHNNDGSKTISFSLSWSANFSPTSASGSDTMVLTTIPRYFTQTPKLELVSKTTKAITLKWTTSENASRSQYSVGDASHWVDVETGINKKTGTMTISGLTANTSYRIYGDFMRADSSLWCQTKPYIDVKTYDYAKLVSAPNFNDENNPTITYTNPLGNAATTLQVCIANTDGTGIGISYRNINKTGTLSYTFNFTEAERNSLRTAATSNSKKVKFYIKTAVDNATYYSEKEATLTIVNGNPTFSSSQLSYLDSNSSIVAITENNQHIVRNQSNLKVTYTGATAKKGASISKYEITFNGGTQTKTSATTIDYGKVNLSSNATVSVKAIDSRGNSTTISKTIQIKDWVLPSATITAGRVNNYEDETRLKANVTISSVNGKNAIQSIQYRYKKSSESNYGSYVNMSNNVQSTLSIDKLYAWDFQIAIADKFGSTTYNFTIAKGMPIMFIDTSKLSVGINSFPANNNEFNVDGNIKQNGVSIIESGSNANGNYIKFNDGTLICYAKKDVIFLFNSNQKWGSMWESDATSLGSFPYAFYETPVVNVTNNSGSGGFIEGLLETTTTNIGKMYICRPLDTNSSIAYTLSIIAIGRWK